MLKHHALNSC